MKKLYLNLGCGASGEEIVHQLFQGEDWQGIRIDDDELVKPDLKANMVTLESVDQYIAETYPDYSHIQNYGKPVSHISGIFSSHALEHLHCDDAFYALCVWRQALRYMNGKLILRLPDFGAACESIVQGRGHTPLYQSPAGPISAMDIVFGFRGFTKERPSMGHLWGYTRDHLERVLCEAGYSSVNVLQDRSAFEIYAFASP